MRHICRLVNIFFLLFQKLCEDRIKVKQTEDLSNMLSKDENKDENLWCGLDYKSSNQHGEKV